MISSIFVRISRAAALVAIAASIALTAPAPAAAQSATGSIEGTVVDQSGGVLPGVTVTVTQTQTALTRTVVTDDNGLFRAELLPVGPYELTAEMQGFSARKQENLRLTIGQTLTVKM